MFTGDDESIGSVAVMPEVPRDPAAIEKLRQTVYANADLFVGNLVSADGKAAMIRARLKEDADNHYMSYWQIKGIIEAEAGQRAAAAGAADPGPPTGNRGAGRGRTAADNNGAPRNRPNGRRTRTRPRITRRRRQSRTTATAFTWQGAPSSKSPPDCTRWRT